MVNIGKLLKEAYSPRKKKMTEKVSVSELLNKACADGITEAGSFSLMGIRRLLKKILRSLDDDFDRDKFFSMFMELYALVMAPSKRAKGVFHPSSLMEDCPRQLVYSLSRCPPSDKKVNTVSGELQRIFDIGTWNHIYFQALLYRLGLLQQAEVPVINKEKYINGKADGVFKDSVFGEKTVLEIKTMNDFNYRKAIFTPFKKHEFQASLYARELGATKVLYLYINKNTCEIRDFLRPLQEDMLLAADKKMDSIIECVEDGTLPKRKCATESCDTALNCPYRTRCFKDL